MDKETIKNWLKNPLNLVLVGIVIFAFIVRLWYFLKVGNQTIWFDEGEYLTLAKEWAFGYPNYLPNPQRPPLFQFLGAIIFMVGLGESFIRFALVLIPSTALVVFVYLLGKEMYDEKIGLVGAFLTAVSWTLLFWGARVQPDFFSMALQVASLWLIWKYWKLQDKNELGEKATRLIIFSAVLAALSFYFKITGLLVPMIVGLFILVKDRLSAFKNRDYWIYAVAYSITMIPYFIWAKVTHGAYLAFRAGYSNPTAQNWPFAWEVLKYVGMLLNPFVNIGNESVASYYISSIFNTRGLLIILFIIGIVIGLKFLLYGDVLIKDKKKAFNPNLFGILALVYIAGFYIFYQRAIEDRWVFLWLPFMFFFIGLALKFIYRYTKKFNKILAIVLVAGLLGFGGYSQLKHSDGLIWNKFDSYKPVEQAGLWIKDNSNIDDIVLSRSKTQNPYYSERETKNYNEFESAEEMDFWISENKPRYFIVSIFEPNPEWTQPWIEKNQNRLNPVQAYLDGQNTALIIYEIAY